MHTPSDPYAATAEAYDLFSESARPSQTAAIEAWLPRLRNDWGPVLDIGAGSGFVAELILERDTAATVFAIEPSTAMRSLLLGRIAAHPNWFDRITVRPEDFFAATLPQRVGGALMLGVIGHFDPGERAAIFAELSDRLPSGGAALFDLQSPVRPAPVEPYVYTAPTVGGLTYQVIAEAWLAGEERLRWRMTYLVLEGERVISESSAEFNYWHPSPEVLATEAEQVGMRLEQLEDTSFWLLIRD
ncbi:MAG: SAM-dependent methyltransferase [Gulosibacter sp.]|uniref:SAM-dependent methyltransferase n=1 Tax=Gulosibacter sp. TaxID=2817531 RepID=UPI003F9107D5